MNSKHETNSEKNKRRRRSERRKTKQELQLVKDDAYADEQEAT